MSEPKKLTPERLAKIHAYPIMEAGYAPLIRDLLSHIAALEQDVLRARCVPTDGLYHQRVARQIAHDAAIVRAEAAEARVKVLEEALVASRPLPFDRDELGRMVREAWVRWAQTQTRPKTSWLVPYDALAEGDKEADRQIGEAMVRWAMMGIAARAALSPPTTEPTT